MVIGVSCAPSGDEGCTMSILVYGLIGLVLLGLLVGVLLIHRRQRLLVDSLIALLFVGIFTCVLLYHRNKQRLSEQHLLVQQAIATLNDQVAYQTALMVEHKSSGGRSFPPFVSPLWFKSGLPMNPLVPGWHAWLDVAPVGDAQNHPPDPIVTHAGQAGIWYNPNSGAVRARVIDQGTDLATLQFYNAVNESNLETLTTSNNLFRRPLPLMSVLVAQEAKVEAKADAQAKTTAETQAAAEVKVAATARVQDEVQARVQVKAQADAQTRAQAESQARSHLESPKQANGEEVDPSQHQERVMPVADTPSPRSDSE